MSTCLHSSSNKVIFVFSLVTSLGKYAFRTQNLYLLFIDCNVETVLRWYSGEVENGEHLSKQFSNLFTVTGSAGKA